jgi:MFS transporter, DHA2 family, multidrug resistance protein
MRNLGGAFGIAILLTVQDTMLAMHRQELYAAANPANPKVADMLAGSAQRMDSIGWRGDDDMAALGQYVRYLDREALVMTFNDQFQFLTVGLLCAMGAVWLMKKPELAPPPPPANAATADAH